MSGLHSRWAWRLALAVLITSGVTHAEDVEERGGAHQFYGPLRARDLSPFGYLRLDMRPTYSGWIEPGRWAVESELGYQNTWALSDNVREYLESFPGRRDLTAADVDAIRQLGGESFLVDLELAELDITFHRQFTRAWGAYVILGGVAYGGGLLDGTIEQFHTAFSLSNHGREGVTRNQINLLLDLKAGQFSDVDASPRSGVLDPTIGVRYSGLQLPAPWSLTLEAATKIPVAGARDWLSTGRTDVGLQASLMRRGERHAFFTSVSLVDYAGADSRLQPGAKLLPTLVVGLDSHLTERTHSILQFYASPSVYDAEETSLEELRAAKYELSLGLRHHRGSHLLTFALTENLASFNNAPDIVMQLGWAYRPAH